jgi:phenylpyruvate tautomerase PptA (4-oxalocrotonate tautomerase family)
MPLAVLHLPQGALDYRQITQAVGEITEAFLEAQGAMPGSAAAHALARVEVQEHPVRMVFLGGQPYDGRPLYRVEFSSPVGALDLDRREWLVRRVTDSILKAEGTSDPADEQRHRVWCIIHPVPADHWACAGRLWDWASIKRWVKRCEIALRRQIRDEPEAYQGPLSVEQAARLVAGEAQAERRTSAGVM